ncbi:MAG: radical SAM protein, partial [Pseudomonadota bacterium]
MEKKVIILVNSPYLDIYGVMNIGDNFSFPLGIGYIASILRQNGYLVKIFEPEIEKLNEEQIKEYFIQEKPDVVGISCATPNFKGAVKIAQIVKNNTFATIVLGGIHASSASEQILKNYDLFNFIVYGEGEYTMLELCNALKDKKQPYSNIKGLYYKENGNIISTPPRPYIEKLDTLPFPARELVDLKNYRPNVHLDLGVPGAHIITSRGCPARCTFCASFKTLGYNFRMHSAEYVVSEIEEVVNKYDINYIIFVDDTFTINKNRAKTICQMILDKKIKIKWYCFSRVDTINEELAKLMKQAGCFSMLFGIESGNTDILRRVKKGISKEKAVQTIHMTNKMGYKTLASFILGLPGETRETIK